MNRFAFIPISLFDANNATQYLPVKKSLQRRADIVSKTFDYYGVVGIADNRGKAITTANVLWSLFDCVGKNVGENIFIKITDKQMFVIVVKDKSLLLANVFEVNKNEDIAYFVLSVVESTSIDVDNATVKIVSNDNDEIVHLLNRYINTEAIQG